MKGIKRVIGMSFVLVCVALAPMAAAADKGIVGTWEFVSKFEGRSSTENVSFSRNDDGTYAGTLSGRWGESKLSDISFADGKLKFVRTMSRGDIEMKTTYEGTLADGKLNGTSKSDWGDAIFEGVLPDDAEKKTGAEAICGKWQLTVTRPAREIVEKMTVTKNEDGTLAATWEAERGENTITNMKCEDGRVSFTRKSTFRNRESESNYDGTLKGDEIKGVFMSDRGERNVNAIRAGSRSTEEMKAIGKWELTSESQRGPRTRTLMIYENMTATYQMRDREVPVQDLKIEGKNISFKVEVSFGEREVKMEYAGQIDGETMKGQFTTERGTRDVTGKKVKEEPKVVVDE